MLKEIPRPGRDGSNDDFETYLSESLRAVKDSAQEIGKGRRDRERKQRAWFGVKFGRRANNDVNRSYNGSVTANREALSIEKRVSELGEVKEKQLRRDSVIKIREKLNGVS